MLNSSSNGKQLLNRFLNTRRQGISTNTILFYKRCLSRYVASYDLTPDSINKFLVNLNCNAGGKLAYFRAIRVFCNWLVRNDYLKDSPLKKVDPPKSAKPILASITDKQVDLFIEKVDSLRDKAIISLFADSGMRLTELASIRHYDINWSNHTITIWGKGNKQRKAPFAKRTAGLLSKVISQNGVGENIWHMKPRGIQNMLLELAKETGFPCNPHSFRRGFACNLHRKGLSTLDIMHLGGWEDLSIVLRYTRSITFDDCLSHYHKVND
ncbi:tyrosine-type recombinase/integrase [Chloroflexota bacterium]